MPTQSTHRPRSLKRSLQRGFTLIELMLVVAIIGILLSFAYPYFIRFNVRARGSEAQIVLNKLNTYFLNLYENNGSFITAGSTLGAQSLVNPVTTGAATGQAAAWDSTLAGYTDIPFAFDGGLKMRYYYVINSPTSITITAEGLIPGLIAMPSGTPTRAGGNYLLIETISSTSISVVEWPNLGATTTAFSQN